MQTAQRTPATALPTRLLVQDAQSGDRRAQLHPVTKDHDVTGVLCSRPETSQWMMGQMEEEGGGEGDTGIGPGSVAQ